MEEKTIQQKRLEELLKELKEEHPEMTQKEFVQEMNPDLPLDHIGPSEQYFSRIKNGRKTLSLEHAAKICNAFNSLCQKDKTGAVRPEWLAGQDNYKTIASYVVGLSMQYYNEDREREESALTSVLLNVIEKEYELSSIEEDSSGRETILVESEGDNYPENIDELLEGMQKGSEEYYDCLDKLKTRVVKRMVIPHEDLVRLQKHLNREAELLVSLYIEEHTFIEEEIS